MIQIVISAIGIVIYVNSEIQIVLIELDVAIKLTFQLRVVDFVAPIGTMAVQRV